MLYSVLLVFSTHQLYFAIIGILFIFVATWFTFINIWKIFGIYILHSFFPSDIKKYGKYAVITGATDGIGKALGLKLAKRGMDIVLISRNLEKLKDTARKFKEENIDVLIIQADFSSGIDIYSSIAKKLKHLDVGILINNVGQQFNLPCVFLDLSEKDLVSLININMLTMLMMSLIYLPGMELKRKGVILNISSLSCIKPLPLMSVYSASKSFMSYFSQALSYEYQNSGIIVQCLIPSFVSTKLTKYSQFLQRKSILIPDADKFASSAVNIIATSNLMTGYWWHEFQKFLYKFCPTWFSNSISVFMFKLLDSRTP